MFPTLAFSQEYLINSLQISMMKAVSLFLTALSLVCVLVIARPAEAATLSTATARDTYQAGDQFNLDIKIDSQDVGINAAQATIKFSPAVLEVVSVDKTGSVFGFWLQDPAYDNKEGTISFIGGASSGLVGKSLQVVRVVFKAKGFGVSSFVFTDGAVTASDGSGTNVLSSMIKGVVTISESQTPSQVKLVERTPITSDSSPKKPIVAVPLYPDPTLWYNNSSKFSASWQLPPDVSAVATSLDKNPTFTPSKSKGVFDNETFGALTDGVWYLHVRFYNNIGWSATTHYRIAIDTAPPAPFEIVFSDGAISDNPTPAVMIKSKDPISSVTHFHVRIDSGEPFVIDEKSNKLPPQIPGVHTMIITAEDLAGNKTESKTQFEILPIEAPRILSVSSPVFSGEGNLFIDGESLSGSEVILDMVDSQGVVVSTFTTKATEKGTWTFKIDSPLKKGRYHVRATARDERGALSLPVESVRIDVEDRPLIVLFGLNLQSTHVITLLLIIVIGGYIIGWYSNRLMSKQRERKILVSSRDVSASFNVIRTDVEDAISAAGKEKKNSEMVTILNRMNENIDKMEKYVITGIKEINDTKI
jgi:hypothetical protein